MITDINILCFRFIRVAKECNFYAYLKRHLKKNLKGKLPINSNTDILLPYVNLHLSQILNICTIDPYNKISLSNFGVNQTYKHCEIEGSDKICLFILCSRILLDIDYMPNFYIKECYKHIFLNGKD